MGETEDIWKRSELGFDPDRLQQESIAGTTPRAAPALSSNRVSFPADRRRELPDEPGVYLFRDARGKVIYVGKAKSIRKRVASHFSNPSTRAGREIVEMIDQIEALVVHTESEALLVEQNFIKQYKPRFNIRLRDDKSYPYIAISLDEDFPRVYFTRERHRRDRAYFGPYSNAKRVRSTLEVLGKVFMFRSCEGPEPGRRSGSPCLDYYIKRCEAPCVGYVSREEYRSGIDGVIAFLSGRYKEIERALESEMRLAAAEQRFEDAARERNRLRAVRSLLERQRVANQTVGTLDAIAVAVREGEANAQVFQVRDGVLSDRQSFYLDNAAGGGIADVAEAFILQYYASAMLVPPLLVVQRESRLGARAGGGAERAPRRTGRDPGRRARRQAADPGARRAQRPARDRPGEAALRAPAPAARRGARRAAAGARARHDPAADRVLRHLDADGHQHGRLDGRVRGRGAEEVRLPALQGPSATRGERRTGDGEPDDFASMEEVLSRRLARLEAQRDLSPHDKEYDPSFAALPNVIVIDGGKGQLAAGLRALQGFRERGVTVISLAKRIEEVFIPGRARRSCCRTTRPSCSCSSASATRRTGSRSPITGSAATGR